MHKNALRAESRSLHQSIKQGFIYDDDSQASSGRSTYWYRFFRRPGHQCCTAVDATKRRCPLCIYCESGPAR
ncbi:hypothetical protein CKO_04573 [Citrobacter koseri ATCC BAA-895]|uniref:Uncharacterized protein n=1 Tax=Citrobacter koseri (strain ATCC BAA-895 / CDC 4225-83 / SGSC4696) TaxID=290338 RepID=A8AQ62_CITK8|nr:hypothetical protein CKO_04573 [Citrobacter koseri ATCC BAA-895]